MKTAATPGPWLRDGNYVYALEHDGWDKGKETFRSRFTIVVRKKSHSIPTAEMEANIRLVLAAPDLLEAWLDFLSAQDIVDRREGYVETGQAQQRQEESIKKARAAITKATGQPSGT